MPLPAPIPLPPVPSRQVERLAAIAHDLREGRADPAAAELLATVLPELLEELTAWREFGDRIRAQSEAVRDAGPDVIALPQARSGAALPPPPCAA